MTKKFHSTSVDLKLVYPHLLELIDRCGSLERAAEYASIGTSTIYRIKHKVYQSVQHKTASKILLSLKHKREEDRKNGKVNPKYVANKNRIAEVERRIDAKNSRNI